MPVEYDLRLKATYPMPKATVAQTTCTREQKSIYSEKNVGMFRITAGSSPVGS
jgi:hypothetical protein